MLFSKNLENSNTDSLLFVASRIILIQIMAQLLSGLAAKGKYLVIIYSVVKIPCVV